MFLLKSSTHWYAYSNSSSLSYTCYHSNVIYPDTERVLWMRSRDSELAYCMLANALSYPNFEISAQYLPRIMLEFSFDEAL